MSLIISCAIVSIRAYAQGPSIQWQKSFGGSLDEDAYSLVKTVDGGFIIAGGTNSTDGDVIGKHDGIDFWLVKLDDAGNLSWQKCLGGSGDEVAESVQLTTDSGYIVCGWTTSNDGDVNGNHGDKDYWLTKLDAYGNLQWQKCYGGSGEDVGYQVQQTIDGGFILSGNTRSSDGDVTNIHSPGVRDIWIVKVDSEGNIEWQKCYGGSAEEYFNANSIQQTQDGGYIFNGYTWSNAGGDVTYNHGADDYWSAKLDEDGTIIWQKSLGGSSNDGGYAVQQTNDGGYIDAGAAYSDDGDVSGGHGYSDCWIVKLDSLGNIDWQKPYGGSNDERPYAITQLNTGGYAFAGYSASDDYDVTGYHFWPNTSDYWVTRIDVSGNLLWEECLGGYSNEEAHTILQTEDGGLILAGFSFSTDGDVVANHGGSDMWIVKLYPDKIIAVENLELINTNLKIFPNPTNGTFMLYLSTANEEENANVKIEVINSLGKVMHAQNAMMANGTLQQEIQLKDVAEGMYLVKAVIGDHAYTAQIDFQK